MISIVYILLALLGLGVLVFIHELGHYFVARRVGMKIEVFSIGLGRPLFSWMHKGVKWQICPLLFGGYVRIAGMDKEGDKEPYEIKDGFYAKKPWARIQVALAGPVVNLLFALILFGVIWISGGREKSFEQFTHLIGFVDPSSELHRRGINPGDELTSYNDEPFEGYQDLIYAAIFNGHDAEIKGNKIDYFTDQKIPYHYTLTPYQSPYLRKGMMSIGILSLANYSIYQSDPREAFAPGHPMEHSGIQNGDRIIWINGSLIFSDEQLRQVINDNRVLVTFERDNEVLVGTVPRLAVSDVQLERDEMLELSDWRYSANLLEKKEALFFIPYALSPNLVVKRLVSFVDDKAHFQTAANIESSLQVGDRLLAIGGTPVHNGAELLDALQKRLMHIIVERGMSKEPLLWKTEDVAFEHEVPWDRMLPIISSIGTDKAIATNAPFHLLNPVEPVKTKDLPLSAAKKALFMQQIEKQREAIEAIDDAATREIALEKLSKENERVVLGVTLRDRTVIYNPNPFALFGSVFQEIAYNLAALVGGYISPKFLVGPVGIVHVMQKSWGDGVKEALFWLGAVSLNLGILNLLPIPVLDGGHICFSLLEAVRRKPFKAKTMRRAMIPFIVLLISFFFYVTYHDLVRLFGRFF